MVSVMGRGEMSYRMRKTLERYYQPLWTKFGISMDALHIVGVWMPRYGSVMVRAFMWYIHIWNGKRKMGYRVKEVMAWHYQLRCTMMLWSASAWMPCISQEQVGSDWSVMVRGSVKCSICNRMMGMFWNKRCNKIVSVVLIGGWLPCTSWEH